MSEEQQLVDGLLGRKKKTLRRGSVEGEATDCTN